MSYVIVGKQYVPGLHGLGFPYQQSAGGLGVLSVSGRPSTLVSNNAQLLTPGRIYTYRTYSSVPLDPDATISVEESWPPAGMQGLGFVFLTIPTLLAAGAAYFGYQRIAANTPWKWVQKKGWRIAPPRGYSSFWQDTTRSSQGYKTSLTFTTTAPGVTAGAAKWAAKHTLNLMRPVDGTPNPPMVISDVGNLYDRDTREQEAGAVSTVTEAVLGRQTSRTTVDPLLESVTGDQAEALRREQARESRKKIGMVVAGLLFVGAFWIAYKAPGAAGVERKIGGTAKGAARVAAGTGKSLAKARTGGILG